MSGPPHAAAPYTQLDLREALGDSSFLLIIHCHGSTDQRASSLKVINHESV